MVPGARVAVGAVTGGDGLPWRSRLCCAGRGKVRGQPAQRRRAPHRGPMAAGPGTAPALGLGQLRLRAGLELAPGWLRPCSAAAAGARALCRDALGLQRPRPERWGGGSGGRGPAPLRRHPCKPTRRRAGRGKWGGSTGPPSPAARGGPRGPPFQPCRCSLPSQGAAKHPRLLPCAVLQADPTRGEQQMGQGARPPLFPPDSWEWEHSSPKQVLRPKLGAECCWVPSSPHANCAIISCSVIAVGAIKWL